MRTFKSILVANRGEIAVRIMTTAQSLGYRTIAVYSEADASAPHVQMADDAVLIGPAPASSSYLDVSRILKAALETGAEAVHPGYGFLSENSDFARACKDAGLVFIGPSPDSIDLMGNKGAAKRRMIDVGVPCIPGYEDVDQSDEILIKASEKIGFPLMVKAAAGGGGRGMRLVHHASKLSDALNSARSESLNAFGSDELILEKAILQPRHVEIQIFADSLGNVIHLGERDCSVQRRHQKVVEEAPCPVMTEDLRDRMGAAAVEAAQSIDYCGAGTVEFLLDGDGNFYFLEMNTRLQVEHPVTEMITGLDLVALQIHAAEGQPLGLSQDDITFSGHAIEVRLYSENTSQDFLPCTGNIDLWQPAEGEGLRFDSGIKTGQHISPFYDPMIAKVIAWGETREIARHRLIEGLKNTALFGPLTNKNFLINVLSKEAFARAEVTTDFIADNFTKSELAETIPSIEQNAIAAIIQFLTDRQKAFEQCVNVSSGLMNWSSGGLLISRYMYAWDDEEFDCTVTPLRDGSYCVNIGESSLSIQLLTMDTIAIQLRINGRRHRILFKSTDVGQLYISHEGQTFNFYNRLIFRKTAEENTASGRIHAPMHGTLIEVFVKPGDMVEIGDRLAVLEAMKMQHDIIASVDGTLLEVCVEAGMQATANDLLFHINETE